MKRIYLLMTLLVALSVSAYAQRTINLSIVHAYGLTATGTKKVIANGEKFLADAGGKGVYYFAWQIKNAGPDSLRTGDTIRIVSAHGSVYYYDFTGGKTSLRANDSITITPSANNGAVTLTPGTAITSSTTNPNYQWCDSVYARKGSANTAISESNVANDETCHTVELTWWVTGINTITGENDGFILYPNPAKDRLNVKFDFNSGADVTVLMRDVTGKVVLQKNMGRMSGMNQFALDVSNLQTGLYTAELLYNNQRIVSKINIQ